MTLEDWLRSQMASGRTAFRAQLSQDERGLVLLDLAPEAAPGEVQHLQVWGDGFGYLNDPDFKIESPLTRAQVRG